MLIGKIINLYNVGDVQGSNVGGIVGYINQKNNEISNCFNVGKISKERDIFQRTGGIAGQIAAGASANINNCYNIAVFSQGNNSNKVGGIVGEISSTVTVTMNKCYYLKQDDIKTAIGNREDDTNQVIACNDISEISATMLNDNINNIEHTDEWKNWKSGEDGYPIFE